MAINQKQSNQRIRKMMKPALIETALFTMVCCPNRIFICNCNLAYNNLLVNICCLNGQNPLLSAEFAACIQPADIHFICDSGQSISLPLQVIHFALHVSFSLPEFRIKLGSETDNRGSL
jgi:hypothetical protein